MLAAERVASNLGALDLARSGDGAAVRRRCQRWLGRSVRGLGVSGASWGGASLFCLV